MGETSKQWSPRPVVSKHDAYFITFLVAASHLAPPALQHVARPVVCCCAVRLGMPLHDLVPIPLQPRDNSCWMWERSDSGSPYIMSPP